LQALDLLMEIERITGTPLPLGTLYQTSTVEGLTDLLKTRASGEADSPLIPLQTAGPRPPVFLIHTTPGDILGYGNLVYHLDSNQPCYGIQSLGLHQPERCHARIEDMARFYIELIRAWQPAGPYYLGGWCYGGIVSVEMAHQLLASGEKVAFLGLLETVAPRPSARVYRYYLHRARCLLRMGPSKWRPYFEAKMRYYKEAKRANRLRFQRVQATSEQRQEACEQQNRKLAQLERVYRSNMAALAEYRPRPYPGTVTLFNAAEIDPGVIPDPAYGWPGLAAKIEVHAVPGDHDTMLSEPHAARLAEKFSKALRGAQAQAQRP
jgi:thioesterase domain-containing protein